MLPKFVCRLVPELVLRKVFVKSRNATGVRVASPILICRGDSGACAGAGAGGSAGFCGSAAVADAVGSGTTADGVDAAVEDGVSWIAGSIEVCSCVRASRGPEIKRADTIAMASINFLTTNLPILDFLSDRRHNGNRFRCEF